MSKVAIVFWSQTGNTETMANCIAEGAGANATIIPCSEMNAAKLASMMWSPLAALQWVPSSWRRASLSRCSRIWRLAERQEGGYVRLLRLGRRPVDARLGGACQGDGAQVFGGEGLICNEAPDDDVQAACRKLGADLAAW